MIAVPASLPRTVVVIVALLLSVLEPLQSRRHTNVGTNDFAFLEPWFNVEQKDRDTLAERRVVAHSLPASHKQISIVATCAVDISADEAVARASSVGSVKRDELVSVRFSEPPIVGDLAPLTLDQGDIDRLRACRPGKCALNLATQEISDLQLALTRRPESPADVQAAFRQVILARLGQYQSGGCCRVTRVSRPPRPGATRRGLFGHPPTDTVFAHAPPRSGGVI
jgi:hypothetical protein